MDPDELNNGLPPPPDDDGDDNDDRGGCYEEEDGEDDDKDKGWKCNFAFILLSLSGQGEASKAPVYTLSSHFSLLSLLAPLVEMSL